MISGISHLVMRVRHFVACRETYCEKLGLPEIAMTVREDGRRACALVVGASVLELREDLDARPALDPETGQPLTSMYDDTAWVSHFAFPVTDAWARYHEFAERGVHWTCQPSDQPVGHHLIRRRLIEFNDPELLTVQLAERIDNQGQPLLLPDLDPDPARQPWPGCDRIDHIMLNTADMATKRRFYVEALGLQGAPPQPTRLGSQSDLAAGKTVLELIWQRTVVPPLHPGTVAEIGFAVHDVDRAYQVLSARGLAVAPPVQVSPFPGLDRRVLYLKDPDGLPLQIVQTTVPL